MPLELKRISVGHYEMSTAEIQAVMDVCASDRLSPGPYVSEFEDAFSKRHGCEYGVMVNSGTDALRIALATLKEAHGWKDGDYVIVPSVTFVATLNVVLQLNLKPLIVDVDALSYNLDTVALHYAAIRYRPKGMLVAHLCGQPAEMDRIMGIVKRFGIKVIEDSCETMGVKYGDKPVGSWGDIGCFSFYMAHLLTTGVGGMATTNNPKYEALMRSYANHGRDPFYIPGRNMPGLSKDLLQRRFKFDRIGYSCRPTEFEAAIGLCQLENLDKQLRARRRVAGKLIERLKHLPLNLPRVQPNREHAYMMFPICLEPGSLFDKWDLCLQLERSGIETRDLLPLINQPCYPWMDTDGLAVAKWINEKGFYIGCHPGMTDDDVEWIGNTFDSFFR